MDLIDAHDDDDIAAGLLAVIAAPFVAKGMHAQEAFERAEVLAEAAQAYVREMRTRPRKV